MNRAYSLQDLELLMQVAERGNMSEVGRQLNMTTAAVSAAIKRLEKALGVNLIERTTRSLRLSAAGETLIPYLQQVLGTLDEAENELGNHQALAVGEIRIGVPSDLGRNRILDSLNAFQTLNPGVSIIVQVSDLIQDLYRDELDIVVRYGEPKDSSLIATKLCDNRRVLVASPAYVANHGQIKRIEDLVNHNCLLFYLSGRLYNKWQFETREGSVSIKVAGNRSANDGELVKRWAIAGEGIAYKSALDVAGELSSGALVELMAGQYEGQPSPIYLLYKERRYQVYRMTALIRHFKKSFA